jgi:ABC-type polysaccharide/polyol phosphate export permease
VNYLFIFFIDIWKSKLVFFQFVDQHITLRYRRTTLGFFWTLINPLFTMAITSIIFSMMMRIPVQNFAVFLFSGLIPWILFNNCLSQGGNVLIENEALIKKVYIPKQLLVLAKCTSLLIEAILSFVALFALAIVIGAKLTGALLFLPIAFALTFIFALGFALLMSITAVYFRDSPHIVGIALQAGYYVTPIIYPVTMVPENYRWVFTINPMFYFVQLFRLPIYENIIPSMQLVVIAFGLAFISLFLGIFTYKKFSTSLIFRL